jgi:hypothetical protein
MATTFMAACAIRSAHRPHMLVSGQQTPADTRAFTVKRFHTENSILLAAHSNRLCTGVGACEGVKRCARWMSWKVVVTWLERSTSDEIKLYYDEARLQS